MADALHQPRSLCWAPDDVGLEYDHETRLTPDPDALIGMSYQSSQSAGPQPNGRLHVHFLGIGQGDGILITTPSGRQVLVDGDKSPQALVNELEQAMPFWDRSVDVRLLTHPDGDHMIGRISVPDRFRVVHALDTAISQANANALPWRESLDDVGATTHVEHKGGWVDLGDSVARWILWPPPGGFEHEHADNESSLVVKQIYGEFSSPVTSACPARMSGFRRMLRLDR